MQLFRQHAVTVNTPTITRTTKTITMTTTTTTVIVTTTTTTVTTATPTVTTVTTVKFELWGPKMGPSEPNSEKIRSQFATLL